MRKRRAGTLDLVYLVDGVHSRESHKGNSHQCGDTHQRNQQSATSKSLWDLFAGGSICCTSSIVVHDLVALIVHQNCHKGLVGWSLLHAVAVTVTVQLDECGIMTISNLKSSYVQKRMHSNLVCHEALYSW
jgi:hypothetical protein